MACGGAFRATLSKGNLSVVFQRNPHRCLVTKESGGVDYVKPPSYNYLRYGYPSDKFFDRTYKRINENSKALVVDGSIGVGKGIVAKKLAEAFDLRFVRDMTEDDIWNFKYFEVPVDFREYNSMLPDSAKFYTMPMFFNDPDPIKNGKPLRLQYQCMITRYWNYCVAMCHLLNTGRGFVMDRSPHSDFAFAKTMMDCGLMSKEAYDFYYYARRNTVPSLWRPHVVVFLRAPLEMVKQRIAERNVPWEVSGRNMNDKFLLALQRNLENDYIDSIRAHSEVFEVNCDELDVHDDEDIAYIVEQISRLDLEGKKLDEYDKKFLQWRDGLHNRDCMDYNRWRLSCEDLIFSCYFDQLRIPFALKEGKYSYQDQALQRRLLDIDPRCDQPPGLSKNRDSLLQRMMGLKRLPANFERAGHQFYILK